MRTRYARPGELSSPPPNRLGACPTSKNFVVRSRDLFAAEGFKKLLLVDGGGDPSGPVCEPMHYHGYVGMEAEAVKLIAGFIKAPSPGS